MESRIFSAKTAEEAIESGLTELGISRDEAEIEILEEGKKKLFGSIPAQVKITPKEKPSDGMRAVKFLEGLFELLGIEATPTISEEDERIVIDLSTSFPA